MKTPYVTLFSVLACSLILNAADRLTINVNPRFVQANGYLRLTCRVPRQAENRQLRYGIVNYMESGRDLEGENAKITWEAPFDHVPCGSSEAYCTVIRNDGTRDRAVMQFLMIGCDDASTPMDSSHAAPNQSPTPR